MTTLRISDNDEQISDNDEQIENICSEIEDEIVKFVENACDIVKSCKVINEELKQKYMNFTGYQKNLKERDEKLEQMIEYKQQYLNNKSEFAKLKSIGWEGMKAQVARTYHGDIKDSIEDTSYGTKPIYNKKNSYITVNKILNTMIDYNYNNKSFDDVYKTTVGSKFSEIKKLNPTLYAKINIYENFILNPTSDCNNNPTGGKPRSKRSRKNKKSKNTRRKSIRRRRR